VIKPMNLEDILFPQAPNARVMKKKMFKIRETAYKMIV
jgi:hypothetical protein